jgi:pilus assembly protein Flp/PilA
MAWLNRERRRRLRTQDPDRDATYRVERDAPEWHAPIPYTGRWLRRAVEFVERVRTDAYPDHLTPFEDLDPAPSDAAPAEPLPPAIAERLPRPRHRKVRLMVASGRKLREVHVEPFNLSRPDLWGRGFLATLAYAIRTAIEEVTREDEGQGLAEYALVLALVAIVAIIALVFIGSQISAVLSDLGGSI